MILCGQTKAITAFAAESAAAGTVLPVLDTQYQRPTRSNNIVRAAA